MVYLFVIKIKTRLKRMKKKLVHYECPKCGEVYMNKGFTFDEVKDKEHKKPIHPVCNECKVKLVRRLDTLTDPKRLEGVRFR